MQIYHSINDFPRLRNPILTLGTFDGVHLGHQKILSRIADLAAREQGEVVLLTFNPHPRKVIFPDQPGLLLITTLEEKAKLLAQYGVQHLIVQPFTRDFSMMDHETFVRDFLVGKIGVKKLVIGYDHQFGHGRKGSFRELQELAPKLGFEVEEISEKDIDDVAVSSTRIRKALQQSKVEDAAALLGYRYTLTGTVIKGKQLGRKLGYPTANLLPDDPDKLVPGNGVYSVHVLRGNEVYKGMLNIGTRPTIDNGMRSIEAHLFDFDQEVYGEKLTLVFHHFLREEVKFPSVEALIEQLHADKKMALEHLAGDSV